MTVNRAGIAWFWGVSNGMSILEVSDAWERAPGIEVAQRRAATLADILDGG
jgi:hypothetical protein